MSNKLTVFVSIKVSEDAKLQVREELISLIRPTLKEPGCITFQMHESYNENAHFIFYEEWASKEALQAHLASPHIKAYRNKTKNQILHTDIQVMKKYNN
ncbi:putative quinol monooxygenase [Spartinivicinus poritis]|uniref:Quinol monooxygenase n=1 Tax=Spartinivicinus poritis TaxID=2994640 RepID=A0ABT5U6A0_9GAMM|nr:putative quinol monooxygenase [Spartinivicinus sp. A2-2]MDE1461885.1 putative quinol monooxygenase [Spartinivicinus sp. A2-2]